MRSRQLAIVYQIGIVTGLLLLFFSVAVFAIDAIREPSMTEVENKEWNFFGMKGTSLAYRGPSLRQYNEIFLIIAGAAMAGISYAQLRKLIRSSTPPPLVKRNGQ